MKISCLAGHKFISLNNKIVCEKCGISHEILNMKRDIFGKVHKAKIVRRKSDVDILLGEDEK